MIMTKIKIITLSFTLPTLVASFSLSAGPHCTTRPFALGGQRLLLPLVPASQQRQCRSMVASASSDTTEGASASAASASEVDTVVVKRLPNSAVEIRIPVPGPATKAAYDKVCKDLSKNISIPGFRKGSKIPPQVLEQAMAAKGGRNALKVQAIQALLEQLVEPTFKEQSLDPIGQPTLQITADELAKSYVPGKSLTLPVQCDVWPDIEWKKTEHEKPYLGLKGKYSRKPFNQDKMEKALADLKERYATLEPIADSNHVLQMGDACTVNMVGYMAVTEDGGVSWSKGEPLPNAASGDRVEVVLGTGRYMEGLVEGLVGGKVGETRTVSVMFPEKLRDKTLAGKHAIFDVEILEASKRIVPAVTDDFANRVRAGLTADSLMAELRKAIDEEDSKEFTPARNKALGEALAQVMDVAVPETLVTNQARERYATMMAEMRDNGVDDETIKQQITPENFNKYKEIFRDIIVRDFKVSMATDEIARLENINVPDYQVQEQMEAIKKDAAEQKEDFDENSIRGKVETTLQRQAVYDWLAERANLEVEYEDEVFDEALMEKLAAETLKREESVTGTEEPAVLDPTAEPMAVEAKEAVVEPVAAVAAKEAVVEPVAEIVVEPVAEIVVEPVAEPVVEPVVEEVPVAPAPVSEETASEPVVAAEAEPVAETEEQRQARYATMSLQERAFQILKDLGTL